MSDVTDGIRDYLASGGLFNPELMDHQRVSNLVIECRDEIERLQMELTKVGNGSYNPALVISAQYADIERLRRLLDLCAQEIFRLSESLEEKSSDLSKVEKAFDRLHEEAERLRASEAAALKALAETEENCRGRFAEYRAEIERLRLENERLWDLCRNVYGSDRFIREVLGDDR